MYFCLIINFCFSDDICVLSACGTAAIINFQCSEDTDESKQSTIKELMSVSLEREKINTVIIKMIINYMNCYEIYFRLAIIEFLTVQNTY